MLSILLKQYWTVQSQKLRENVPYPAEINAQTNRRWFRCDFSKLPILEVSSYMRFAHAFGIVTSFTKNNINPLLGIFNTDISTLLKSYCQRDDDESV